LWNSRVDGMLVSISRQTTKFNHFKELLQEDLPIVFFDRVPKELDTSQVIVDDYMGAYKAVELLINKGCQHIVHLSGPATLDISINRKKGYVDALKSHNMEIHDALIQPCIQGTYEESKAITYDLLKQHPEIDGIFASNDMAALGSILALQQLNIAIPERVKVVGFSDWQLSSLIKPTLTTVSQAGFEMGQEAAGILINEIEAKIKPAHVKKIISTKLIERETT